MSNGVPSVACARCDDYQYVDDGNGGPLIGCPDCHPEPVVTRARFSADRVQRIRSNAPRPNVIPISFYRCPVHNRKVGFDGEGKLVGQCDGCAKDCADGLRWMTTHKVAA